MHVVFGTGALGAAAIDELVVRGERVRAVNRSGRADIADGIEIRAGDVRDHAFARDAASGADVVYFALNPPYHQWAEQFAGLQESVIDAAIAAGAKLVVLENLYVYGQPQTTELTEDHPLAAHTRKGRVRAEMHQRVMQAHEAGQIRVAAARPSDYFGPRTVASAADFRFFRPAIAGKTVRVLGDPAAAHTYTFTADVGRALAVLGSDDRADGQVWHVPSPPAITPAEFVNRIAAVAGTTAKTASVPKPMFRMIALFNKAVGELVEMLYEFEEPFRMDSSKFEDTFGATATPLDDAIAATIDWYRANPSK
jgi:nucleoside-diphosphate-sugar epimerase